MNKEQIIRQFMPDNIMRSLKDISSCVISFSGGIDSSLLVLLMAELIPPENIHAVTFSSWLHFRNELERTEKFCSELGVRHCFLPGPELEIPEVLRNEPHRCALCKEARIGSLLRYAEKHSIEIVLEGSNSDDLKDPSRLGTKLLDKYPGIRSPLAEAGLKKDTVRKMSRDLGISWWNDNASACLATRFPFYTPLEEKKLLQTAALESALRQMGMPGVRLRVSGTDARIEVEPDLLEKAFQLRDSITAVLKDGGFSRISLDLEGYRSYVPGKYEDNNNDQEEPE